MHHYRQDTLRPGKGVAVDPTYASDVCLGLLALEGARARGHPVADAGEGVILPW
jgi:hypothetical protein